MVDSLINERFQLHEKLGEGGMAVVYRATDLDAGKDVALKLMKPSLSGTARRRFAREFRAVASIDHPHCIKVFDFAETNDCPFFTMELFRGQPITQLFGNEVRIIQSALYQAASAVEYIHTQQIIHRDLKPSNLLTIVEQEGFTNCVTLKLTDFGLARFYGTPSSLSIDSGFVGTLAYSAPEQISGGPIDNRCDVYSLGIICYELLTGRHPFQRARVSGTPALIRAHLAEIPLPVRTLQPDVAPALDELLLSMMEKQPSNRPASAMSLKLLLASYLGIEEPAAAAVEHAVNRPVLSQDTLIARDSELDEISSLMMQSLSPVQLPSGADMESFIPSVVFVTGEAGMGKSHFLREVARLAIRHGADVYEGRCFEGNLAPYQPFVEIVRQLLSRMGSVDLSPPDRLVSPSQATAAGWTETPRDLAQMTETEAYGCTIETIQDVVRNYAAELLRMAPDLHAWLPGKAFRQVDVSREVNYVFRAIATFFVDVATLHGTCLLIEDMHWADQSSRDLLRHIASIIHRTRQQCADGNRSFPRLFICCTARPDEIRFSRELERDRYAKVVPLGALNSSETRQLVALVLRARSASVSNELNDQVVHACKGNPYFIKESVSLWQSSGRIIHKASQWTVDTSDGSSFDWPASVRGVLRSRLQTISPAAQQLLGPCAVIGSIIPVDLLRQVVTELNESSFLDALDELLARQIVFEAADPSYLEFSHDLLRELAYERLASYRRRALHRRIGEALEQAGPGHAPREQLATHFYEARVADRAFRYLLDASEGALASYAIDEALRHIQRAAELEHEIDDLHQKIRIHGIAAKAYAAAGKPTEAIGSYQRQLALCTDGIETGWILSEIGELHFRIGDFDKAVEVFDQALQQIGDRRPRSYAVALMSTVSSFLRFGLPRWLNTPWLHKKARLKRMQVAHRIFSTLELLWAQRNIVYCGQAHGRHLLSAAQIGGPSFLTHASARQALFFGIFSINRLALRAGQNALTYAKAADDREAAAIAKGYVGCAHYFGARLKDGERLLREALSVLDRRGDSWERLYFYHNLRHLYSITGNAAQEIDCARVEMQIGESVNDPEGTCWGSYGVANALARSGRHEEAQQYMQRALGILSGRVNIVVVPTALQTYGFVRLQSGDYKGAREILEESCKNIRQTWAFVEYAVRAYPLLVESLLGPNWYDSAAQHDEAVVGRSWRISRVAMFWAWRFPNYMPHALRVRGRAAWAVRKRKRAIAYFLRAAAVGRDIGARFDVARAYFDLSKVGGDEQADYRERATELISELGASLPLGEEWS